MGSREWGRIEKIKVYPAKGEAGKELAEARLIENSGLEGDYYAKGGERQISLLFVEDSGTANAVKEKGLCTPRFKENISIRCQAPFSGARLAVGEAMLEISSETKHCHEECPLYQAGKRCSLAGKNLFAKVIKGGIIRVEDEVECIIHE